MINQHAYDRCCEGCSRASYTAPQGQQTYPGCDPRLGEPHASCMALPDRFIPIRTIGGRKVYDAPAECPRRIELSQGSLL